jgi:FKBP-type peptidyl-prolyl cis-trans isomerase
MRCFRFPVLALLAVLVTACLEKSPFVPRIEDVTFAPELGVNLAASTKTASGLYYRDITVGGGATVPTTNGDTAFVRYQGWLRNNVSFDNNLSAVQPFAFVTGANRVIDGFDEGVRGMRAGGVRQLIIPPSLGYGASGSGSIPGNSILVFTITLTRVGFPATP